MKNYRILTVLALSFLLPAGGFSVPIGFNSGPLHVSPAWTLAKGKLLLGAHSRAYFKDEVTTNADGSSSGITYWDIQGALGLYYGFSKNLELGVYQVIYQDNHKGGKGYNLPDDLYFTGRIGSLGPSGSSVRFGLQVDLKMPTAEHYNLPLEPYAADRIGIGLTALFSILSKPLSPSEDININANVGFFNHNDLGLKQTNLDEDKIIVEDDTKELLYGVSFAKNMQEFGYFFELYGSSFIQEPPITAFTRETSLFVSPGITYAPNSKFALRAALDLRILGGNEESVFAPESGSLLEKPWETVPNLPSWRINVGATYALLEAKEDQAQQLARRDADREAMGSPQYDEKIYQELARERQKTESAEEELERIRAERERMEKLLERLRNILEYPSKGEPAEQSQEQEQEQEPEQPEEQNPEEQ